MTLGALLNTLEGETHHKQAFIALLVGDSSILSIGILHGGEGRIDGLQNIDRSGRIMIGIKLVPIVE